jgi:hypothetical protein
VTAVLVPTIVPAVELILTLILNDSVYPVVGLNAKVTELFEKAVEAPCV